MDLLARPFDALTPADVHQLIDQALPESDTLEFKETLPSRGDRADPWLDGSGELGERARNEILAEIIAFANAHGGHLIVGVEETGDHPRRAAGLKPLPRCAELADRLRMQARDCIEPQVPVVEVVGVPTERDGSGVVVTSIPRSRLAPHRLIPTRECYIRRADRTEKMTMREIQDLTLQREQGMSRLDARFAERKAEFRDMLNQFAATTGIHDLIAVRTTLIPAITPLYVDRVYQNHDVMPPFETALKVVYGTSEILLGLPQPSWSARPILGGVRYGERESAFSIVRDIYRDGLIEYRLIAPTDPGVPVELRRKHVLYASWAVGIPLNALLAANCFRRAAGVPSAEYGLEIEYVSTRGPLKVTGFGSASITFVRQVEPNPLLLRRLSLGSAFEIPALAHLIFRDLLNAAGDDLGDVQFKALIPVKYLA